MEINTEKLRSLAEQLEWGATADIYFDAGDYAKQESDDVERECLESTAQNISELCDAQIEAAEILREAAQGHIILKGDNIFMVQDCQDEDICKLVPKACPECGYTDLEVEGNQCLISDGSIGKFLDGTGFLAYEVKDWNPIYYLAYGWNCQSCGHEEPFERVMRVAYP